MKRPLKIAIFALVGIAVIAACVCLAIIRSLAGGNVETANEIKVTPEFAAGMRSAGFPITVERAFEASSYGGWHGDGESLSAYRYLSSESPALITALKVRYPSYVWTATNWDRVGILNDLLPKEFLPKNDSTPLLVGKPAEGLPLLEFVINPTEGMFYWIDNRF